MGVEVFRAGAWGPRGRVFAQLDNGAMDNYIRFYNCSLLRNL